MGAGATAFHRWKSCERKRAYESAELARQKGQDVYLCQFCGKWHRTSGITKLLWNVRGRR